MKLKTTLFTLAVCIVISFLHLLLFYFLMGGNPAHRLGYGIFVSVTPALAALLWLWMKQPAWSWWRTAEVYFLLFLATMILQSYGRMIPVYQIAQSFSR